MRYEKIDWEGRHGNHDTEVVKRGSVVYDVCHDCRVGVVRCEIYSRVVGYLRPVGMWNRGKKEEFRLRKEYKIRA